MNTYPVPAVLLSGPSLSLNSGTGVISGTLSTSADASSPYLVTVTASDGSHSSSQHFLWNVARVVVASDTANAALTYSAYNLPPGLSIGSSSGLVSGTPTTGDSSSSPYAVVVTASDGSYSSSDSFTWSVTMVANPVPTLTNPGTQSNASGDSVQLALAASDVPGDVLSFSATNLPEGLSIDPSTGIVSGSLATAAASIMPYAVSVTVDNGNGGSATQT